MKRKRIEKRENQKRWMYLAFSFLICMGVLVSCGAKSDKNSTAETQEETSAEEYLTGKHKIEIDIKDKGVIYAELDADAAPITVTNFIHLVESGFYDGLTFHRVVDGFMIQGGDPEGTGLGGSENKIKGEFLNNGVENPLTHTRGAISMARSMLKDSASSQFFIVQQDSPHLDGDYAVFGYVTEGMEIVDDICKTATGQDPTGVLPTGNQPVIERITVVEESSGLKGITSETNQVLSETEKRPEYYYLAAEETERILLPYICLYSDQTFTLSCHAFSSYLAFGTFQTEEEILMAKSEDGNCYLFQVTDENTLKFIKENSSEIQSVEDGAEFIRME